MFVKVVAYPNIFTRLTRRFSPLVKNFTPSRPSQIFGSPCQQLQQVSKQESFSRFFALDRWRIPTTKNQPPQRSASQDPKTNRKKSPWKMVVGKGSFPYLFGKPKEERVGNVMLVSGRVFLGLCLPGNCKSIN